MIERSLIYSAADPQARGQDRVTIVVHRTRGGWQMRYNAYGVVVDGHKVAKLRRGRTVKVSVRSGTHRGELTVDWSVASPSRRVTVAADQRCYLVNTANPFLQVLTTVHSREFLTLDLVSEPSSAAEDIPREGI
ncbi:hypothetical protein IU429_29300 [Nocardia elegans]|uniref:Uncharacterized protein n=1 Tax=Nocardia elegans TaxID=300029 RepID=A0ABW6TL22_9NOCA|nr:hypothetical protein [Nocardia elegans]